MELQIRALQESDWETMQLWWKAWGWPEVTKDLMPLDGLGGLIVEKDGKAIASGFCILRTLRLLGQSGLYLILNIDQTIE